MLVKYLWFEIKSPAYLHIEERENQPCISVVMGTTLKAVTSLRNIHP